MSKRKKLQHQIDDLQKQANQYTQQSTEQLQNLQQPGIAQLEGLPGLQNAPVAPKAPEDPTSAITSDPDFIHNLAGSLHLSTGQVKDLLAHPDHVTSDELRSKIDTAIHNDERWGQYVADQHQYGIDQATYNLAQNHYQQQAEQARQQLYQSATQNLNPNITQDPRLQQAQMGALTNLEQIGQQGFTQQDKDALNAAMFQSGQQERSEREAQLQQARARGMGGSGLEFASALGAQQGAANRNYNTAAQLGVQARQRALDAIVASGQMGTQMQSQDYQRQAQQFGQQMQQGNALDAFKQWATGNQQGAAQQAFQNKFATTTGQVGALQGAAGLSYTGAGQAQQQLQSNTSAITGTINSIAQSAGSFV